MDSISRAISQALPVLAQASANIAERRYNTFEPGSSIDTAIKVMVGNADLIAAAPDLQKELVMAARMVSVLTRMLLGDIRKNKQDIRGMESHLDRFVKVLKSAGVQDVESFTWTDKAKARS